MSSIKVSWRGIQSAADECDSHRQELADHISSLRGIKSCRAMSGGEFSAIYKVLDQVIDGLEDEKRSLKSLSDGLTAVKKEYTEFENKIAGNIRSVSAEDVEAEEHSFEFPWSDLWSMISEGGIVGSGIAAAANMVTEEWSIGSIIDTAGYGISAIGDAAEAAANGTETDWAEALFGLDDVFKEMDFTDLTGAQRAGKAFKQSLINSWDDLIPDMKLFDSGAKFTERLSSFAKWAGPILTVGSNLFENIEEFKGQDGKTGRIIAETAVESAVDIGLGIAATAGVTAAAAALIGEDDAIVLDGLGDPTVVGGRQGARAGSARASLEVHEQRQVVVGVLRIADNPVEQLDALRCSGYRGREGAHAHRHSHREQGGLEPAPVEGHVDGVVLDIESGYMVAGEFRHGGSSKSVLVALHHATG